MTKKKADSKPSKQATNRQNDGQTEKIEIKACNITKQQFFYLKGLKNLNRKIFANKSNEFLYKAIQKKQIRAHLRTD